MDFEALKLKYNKQNAEKKEKEQDVERIETDIEQKNNTKKEISAIERYKKVSETVVVKKREKSSPNFYDSVQKVDVKGIPKSIVDFVRSKVPLARSNAQALSAFIYNYSENVIIPNEIKDLALMIEDDAEESKNYEIIELNKKIVDLSQKLETCLYFITGIYCQSMVDMKFTTPSFGSDDDVDSVGFESVRLNQIKQFAEDFVKERLKDEAIKNSRSANFHKKK